MHDRRTPNSRILQLVTHDRLGGVRTLVTMVDTGLREQGYAVDTLALTSERGGLTVLSDLWRVTSRILGGHYDTILTYQAAASVVGNLLGWMRRVPIRAAHQTAAPEGIRPHWKVIDRLFGSWGIYTHLISNSTATSQSFAAWPKTYLDRFVLIPHGVDPLPAAQDAGWRSELSIPREALLLVATGRLVDQKNHATAIEALALLPSAHLVIAGDGPDQAELEALAARLGVAARLHLVGAVERHNLGGLFAAADIYIFPSVWETFGLAGVEAAIAGLPIVASDLPVLREVLETGITGMVRFHAPHDAAGLAQGVRDTTAAYPDKETRADFAAQHREHHSTAHMIGLYKDFLSASKAR